MRKITRFEVVPMEEVLRKVGLLQQVSPGDDVDVLPLPLVKLSESSNPAPVKNAQVEKRNHS